MWFYNLGAATWDAAQAIVGALAQLGREGAVLARLQTPCLCAGGQVDLDQEVDLDFCRAHSISVFHRETRGATLCFAQAQLELQVVVARNHRLLAPGADKFRAALFPLLETCRDLGLDAACKVPNEIVVGGRRIASACLGEIKESAVIAASLALEFDAALFARVLNAPDQDLRARLAELARTHRTSVREELGALPSSEVLERQVRGHLQSVVGGLRPAEIDLALRARMRDRAAAWLAPARGRRRVAANGWKVDVGAGAELQQCTYKAPGGFLRAVCEWRDGRIVHASLSGDFFCYPPGALYRLEDALVGARGDQVGAKVGDCYRELGLVTPGVQPAHWAKMLAPV
jgi:lipoate-protein ligase A